MLKEKTNKLIDEMDGFMKFMVDQTIDSDMFEHMDGTEFDALKRCMKLISLSKDVMLEQATSIDEINRKLDLLLMKVEA